MYRQEPQPIDSPHHSRHTTPDPAAYLLHIGIHSTAASPTLAYLKKLQRHHLLHVPFENLNIQYFRKIDLSIPFFYKKVIQEKRGGYCYELNGLFHWLLKKEGFRADLISARVFNSRETAGPEFDHLAIAVSLEEKKYLVEVGFGDFSARPLLIRAGVEQKDENGLFMLHEYDEHSFIVVKKQGRVWKHQYIFSMKPHELHEFQGMHHFHQTSPESLFTRKKICSIMTPKGRITLTNNRLIITDNGQKSQHTFHTENEFNKLLQKHFGFRMDED